MPLSVTVEGRVQKRFDCVVAGEMCVDIPVRPVQRNLSLSEIELIRVDPIHPCGGGIVSNSGIALARLGVRAAAFGFLGDDPWADMLCKLYEQNGLNTEYVLRHSTVASSATVVLVAEDGEHAFAHHSGASRYLDQETVLDHLELFEQTEFVLLGYYSLLPRLEADLPELLSVIRATGCRIAMDAAGGGGTLEPLDRILPHLDFYIPSHKEGLSQTGKTDAREMIETYRRYTRDTVLGIKLGDQGALLSPRNGVWLSVAPVPAPGPVVDTTGAGDSFYAGLITGLLRGFELPEAAKLAAATGACCVTALGTTAGIRGFDETMDLIL